MLKIGDASNLHDRKLVETTWDGTQEWLWFDHNDNPVGLQYVSDHSSVIEANKRAKTDGTRGFGQTREIQKLASIPVELLMDYCTEHGIPLQYAMGGPGQMEVIERMLNDSDYSLIRVDR